MDKETWFEYYTPENHKVLEQIKQLEFGEIRIEIHEKRPVYILHPMKKIRLYNAKHNRKLHKLSEK